MTASSIIESILRGADVGLAVSRAKHDRSSPVTQRLIADVKNMRVLPTPDPWREFTDGPPNAQYVLRQRHRPSPSERLYTQMLSWSMQGYSVELVQKIGEQDRLVLRRGDERREVLLLDLDQQRRQFERMFPKIEGVTGIREAIEDARAEMRLKG